MPKKPKTLPRLAAAVTVLMLLNLFTLVLTAEAILQVRDDTPVTTMELAPPAAPQQPQSQETAPQQTAPVETVPQQTAPQVQAPPKRPGSQVDDADQVWTQNTEIVIFHAVYDNDLGQVTVVSSNEDSLIAPGTGDQYYFHIRNTGNVALDYYLSAHANVNFTSGDTQLELPLHVRFSDYKGNFLVGTDDSFAFVEALDGITDSATLSAGHYAKYTLEWEWPFEGDDELDTLLGNMAAEGDEIWVTISFNVRCQADTDDDGGGLPPQTGDTRNIALWAGLYVCSGFILVILLFTRRKEEENEQQA